MLESVRLAESRVDRRTGSRVLHPFTISVALSLLKVVYQWGATEGAFSGVVTSWYHTSDRTMASTSLNMTHETQKITGGVL